MKALKIAAICLVVIFVAGALVFALGVPVGFLMKPIGDRVEAATGYRLRAARDTRLTFWPVLTLSSRDVSIDRDGEPDSGFSAQSIQVSLTPASVFSGRPEVTEIVVGRPVLRLPLQRERIDLASLRPSGQPSGEPAGRPARIVIKRVTVADGAVIFASRKESYQSRIEHIDLTAALTGREDAIDAKAQWDDRPVHFALKGNGLFGGFGGDSVPVEFTFEAPDFTQSVTGAANIQVSGSLLAVNGLAGAIGQDRFNGSASIDFASKPLIKADVDFRRLAISLARPPKLAVAPGGSARPAVQPPPWSDQELRLEGLNFFDADIQFSAAEFAVDAFHLSPMSIHVSVQRGVAMAALGASGLYGGRVDGTLGLDAAGPLPTAMMRVNLSEVGALPLLTDLFDFRAVDGRMRAAVDVQATGASERAAVTSLRGSVEFAAQDGQLRGINVAKMIRALTTMTLSGWQDSPTERTDFTEFRALYRIDDGKAHTEDLWLASPLVRVRGNGTVDLVNRTLAFKFDPRLVISLEGQGGAADPVGLGVPVVVEGPWNDPHIYPDISGILENPDAAYARLRALGQGLFGREQSGGALDTFLQGLGTFLNSSKGDRRDNPNPAPGGKHADPPGGQDPARDFLRNLLGR